MDIEGAKIYHGSCQCGAVRVAVKCKDLHSPEAAKPISCGCSFCSRVSLPPVVLNSKDQSADQDLPKNGNIWIYPKREQVAFQGHDNLSHYVCKDKLASKMFCKTCGVSMSAQWLELSREQLDSLSEETRKYREEKRDQFLVNIRVFDDFSMDGLKINRIPGDHGKPYVNP